MHTKHIYSHDAKASEAILLILFVVFLAENSTDAISESPLSIRKLRRCLRQFVLSRLLFAKSTIGADLEKRESEIEKAILRIAA